jgi:hypothetical protein
MVSALRLSVAKRVLADSHLSSATAIDCPLSLRERARVRGK